MPHSKSVQFGLDRFLVDTQFRKGLSGKRIAVLAHPASLTVDFKHAVDALFECRDLKITAAFGPQHGMRGEKQDNMIETEDYVDPVHKIPVFSLYGEVRRPTQKMLDTFDAILVDLQDVGTRIYTFLTTLFYILEAGAAHKKSVYILDRPNPAGREIEGTFLQDGWQSFVGCSHFPMRHGMTLGECALWLKSHHKLNVDLHVVSMKNYNPAQSPGYGWPVLERPWVNPSPNAASLNMTRCFPGTVLLEGTHLSEGRGTTRPLEMFGAPDLDMSKVLKTMQSLAPQWMKGALVRLCYFQPTFHKHVGKICEGIQLHTDDPSYQPGLFKPYRFIALWLKSIRACYPSYEIWRDFPYEYETERLAIDLINGGPFLREWVDHKGSTPDDFEARQLKDESKWKEIRKPFLLYSE